MKSSLLKGVALVVLLCGSSAVFAEGGKAAASNPKYKEECGSCHTAFPPRLLTADNWQKLMGGLDKHFGANAALDAKDGAEILDFLKRNAGSGGRHESSTLRISETSWFTREHREVSSKTWANPAVKSKADCTACHVNADRGDWSERGIRMPGGQRHEDHDD